jgi:hypothetical protein
MGATEDWKLEIGNWKSTTCGLKQRTPLEARWAQLKIEN